MGRACRRHREADDAAETPLPHAFLDGLEQILRSSSWIATSRRRNVKWMRLQSHPGNKADKWAATMSSNHIGPRAARPRFPGRPAPNPLPGASCGRESGTFTRGEVLVPLAVANRNRQVSSIRFEICGNGRPGSNASGVSTGKTVSEKVFATAVAGRTQFVIGVDEDSLFVEQPRSASPGTGAPHSTAS